MGVSVQGCLAGTWTRDIDPLKEHGIRDRDPSARRNMGPETATPLESTWDKAARQEVTSHRDSRE